MHAPQNVRFLAVCAALFCGLQTAPASSLVDNLEAGREQTVVLYGTSLTQFGRWADTVKGHGGLADWLSGRYGGRAKVINSGMAGKASNSGVAQLDDKVLAYHPDTVILEFSVNDAYTGYPPAALDRGISLEQSKANLVTMIDRILAANPKTEIILQTMNPAWDANAAQQGSKRPGLAAYYQVYRDVAKERGLLLVDHDSSWRQMQTSRKAEFAAAVPDGVHPTAPASLAVTLPALQKALLEE